MVSENISEENALRNYVEQSYSKHRHPTTRKKVAEFLAKQSPITEEKVVYRGVKSNFPTNIFSFTPYFPKDFFSTSDDLEQAKSFMRYLVSGPNCCVLEIHIQPGVRILDVQSFLDMSNYLSFEQEWLVEGSGQFFANKEKTIPGFMALSQKGHFKTYYFPETNNIHLQSLMNQSQTHHIPAVRQTKCKGPTCVIMGGRVMRRTLHQKRRKNESRKRKHTHHK